jgi:hypothetical protein
MLRTPTAGADDHTKRSFVSLYATSQLGSGRNAPICHCEGAERLRQSLAFRGQSGAVSRKAAENAEMFDLAIEWGFF